MGAACFPGLARGWTGQRGFTAWAFCCLPPSSSSQATGGTPHGWLTTQVRGRTVVRAALRGWAWVSGGLAQASRRVIVMS